MPPIPAIRVQGLPVDLHPLIVTEAFDVRRRDISLAHDSSSGKATATVAFPYGAPADVLQRKCSTGVVDKSFHRLTVMVSGEEDTADVIGIHGLNGHGFNTWVDARDDVMWLREYLGLQHELAGVRIMSFGYDTTGCAPTATGGNMQRVEDVAKGLCECIEGMRIDNPLRPIVFVAYGLGGVVVKQALRYASRHDRFRDIHDATTGMIFLGYPSDHSGVTYHAGAIALNSLTPGVVRGQLSREDTFESVGFYEISGDQGKTYVIEDGQKRTEDKTRHDYKMVSTYVMRMIRDAQGTDEGTTRANVQGITQQREERHSSTSPPHGSNGLRMNQSRPEPLRLSPIKCGHSAGADRTESLLRQGPSTKNTVMEQSTLEPSKSSLIQCGLSARPDRTEPYLILGPLKSLPPQAQPPQAQSPQAQPPSSTPNSLLNSTTHLNNSSASIVCGFGLGMTLTIPQYSDITTHQSVSKPKPKFHSGTPQTNINDPRPQPLPENGCITQSNASECQGCGTSLSGQSLIVEV
ncbi:hypothetical protein BDD12DRAFT_979200 [Trichophaea hybrida]|nr:hypothetical protein BDD12DRAFT_979200 [Trichophaea hybrida]